MLPAAVLIALIFFLSLSSFGFGLFLDATEPGQTAEPRSRLACRCVSETVILLPSHTAQTTDAISAR